MTRQRSTITKADYDKAAAFLKAMGLTVVHMDILPGKASLTLSDGAEIGLPISAEENRAMEKWGASGPGAVSSKRKKS